MHKWKKKHSKIIQAMMEYRREFTAVLNVN